MKKIKSKFQTLSEDACKSENSSMSDKALIESQEIANLSSDKLAYSKPTLKKIGKFSILTEFGAGSETLE